MALELALLEDARAYIPRLSFIFQLFLLFLFTTCVYHILHPCLPTITNSLSLILFLLLPPRVSVALICWYPCFFTQTLPYSPHLLCVRKLIWPGGVTA